MKAKEYTFDASYQPQVRTKTDTSRIMLDVIIALVPAMAFGVYQFGFKVLALLAISVASAVFFEWGYRKLMKKPGSINDLSACVTGILLVLCLPVDAPLWMPVIGTFFAIVIVKQLYGGIGQELRQPCSGRPCVPVFLLDGHHDKLGRSQGSRRRIRRGRRRHHGYSAEPPQRGQRHCGSGL